MKTWTYGTAVFVIAATLAGAASAQGGRGGIDFSTLDVSGDGLLTVEDLEARQAERFADMDANADGSVDAEEFAAFAGDRAGERAMRMFERLDADGDGVVSRDALEARSGDRAPRLERMISRFDANGDGALSEAEFDTARAEMRDRRGGKDRGVQR
ncbi:MAG: calcium-binding protein [Pseudomonadota bacterium]